MNRIIPDDCGPEANVFSSFPRSYHSVFHVKLCALLSSSRIPPAGDFGPDNSACVLLRPQQDVLQRPSLLLLGFLVQSFVFGPDVVLVLVVDMDKRPLDVAEACVHDAVR